MEPGQKRVLPTNELDFNMLTTNSVWGQPEISKDLKDKLSKHFSELDKDGNPKVDDKGNPIVTKESMWGLLGFYTRDMRLANLSYREGEIHYCQYFLNLANDFLNADMMEPFLISLSRVASVLELSQSKSGFLRRRMHTFTSEQHFKGDQDQIKKSLFGVNAGGRK